MSTNVHTHTTDVLAIEKAEVDTVNLTTCASEVTVDRAEFLAAVATELDVKIIDPSNLPEVYIEHETVDFVYGEKCHTEPIPEGMSADELIALGLELKANPIDEAQVDALADLIADVGIPGTAHSSPSTVLAEALVRRGVRAPQAGDAR